MFSISSLMARSSPFLTHFEKKSVCLNQFQLRAIKKKTLRPLFMAGVQLCQDYRATTRRQLTFYH